MIYFIADLHFYHNNILKLCKQTRQFDDIFDMNESLIKAWNWKVKEDDIIYFLGDFSWGSFQQNKEIFNKLNGKKHLIIGNHDNQETRNLNWLSQSTYLELSINDRKIVLCHYPILCYNGMERGAIHLYGHVHNKKLENMSKNSLDVGVDSIGIYPWSFDEIKERLSKNVG